MSALLAALAAACALGMIPTAWLVARALRRGDIRRLGSGNVGTANALRVLGRGPALVTLAGDLLKGWGAVYSALLLTGDMRAGLAALFLAVAAHVFNPLLGFRGGKGLATLAGGMLLVSLGPGLLFFALMGLGARLLHDANRAAAACLPALPLVLGVAQGLPGALAGLALFLVMGWKHRAFYRKLLGLEGDHVDGD